jgi:allantoinase
LRPAKDESPEGRRSYPNYLATRPPDAERAAVNLLRRLSDETGCRVHIVHVSSGETLPLIREARTSKGSVTAESCPHHLHFAAEEIADGRTEYKCAPPIRGADDRDALWRALGDGTLDLIVTDHSPCPPGMKRTDEGDFLEAWGGIASLQLGLSVVWTGARQRGFGLNDIARWMSAGPAALAGLRRKGALAIGNDADLVAFEPDTEWTVEPRRLHHRHKITPYAGARLTGVVRSTFVRGECVFRDGAIGQAGGGQILNGGGGADDV